MEIVFAGTTVKLKLTGDDQSTTPQSMENCPFDVYVWSNKTNTAQCSKPDSAIHFSKTSCVQVDADSYIVEVDTTNLETGYIVARLEISVPDEDCTSGYRKEVLQMIPNIQIV